jgi:hypothetical protein
LIVIYKITFLSLVYAENIRGFICRKFLDGPDRQALMKKLLPSFVQNELDSTSTDLSPCIVPGIINKIYQPYRRIKNTEGTASPHYSAKKTVRKLIQEHKAHTEAVLKCLTKPVLERVRNWTDWEVEEAHCKELQPALNLFSAPIESFAAVQEVCNIYLILKHTELKYCLGEDHAQ